MRILYLATTGPGDATKASVPFHLAANGSLAAGQECAVALVGDAVEFVQRALAEQVEGMGIPPARDLLHKLREHDVPVYV